MSLARGSETETHGKGTGELRQRAVASLTSTHILSHRNTHTHTQRRLSYQWVKKFFKLFK